MYRPQVIHSQTPASLPRARSQPQATYGRAGHHERKQHPGKSPIGISQDAAQVLATSSPLLIQAAAEQVGKAFPQGIDVLVNNAGNQESLCRAVET